MAKTIPVACTLTSAEPRRHKASAGTGSSPGR